MAILTKDQEYGISNYSVDLTFGSTTYRGQSFTTGSDVDNIARFNAYMQGTGSSAHDIYCDIYLADGSDKPTGASLGQASIPGFTSGIEFKSFDFSTPITLSPSTKYVAIISSPSAPSIVTYKWGGDNSSASYSGGIYLVSTTSGSSWVTNSSFDYIFETYYDNSTFEGSDTINISEDLSVQVNYLKNINDSVSLSENLIVTHRTAGMTITIDGQDKTRFIKQESLNIDKALTRRIDTCKFTIQKIKNGTILNYKPKIGNTIIITDTLTGDKIFGGIITRVNQYLDTSKTLLFDIECEDFTRFLDRKLVAKSYSNETVADIIDDIVATYTLPFTTNNVDADITIDYIGFNYLPVSKCLEQLADLISYDWYVDPDKDIHFFAKNANSAPFDIIDTDGSYLNNSLKIKQDNSQVRNVIYVRGGEYLADTFTTEIEADGVRNIFDIPYKYDSGLQVTLTGNPLSIGTDYISEANDYDILWNYQEKLIKFKEADKPSNGATISIVGRPYLPVRIRQPDSSSIASMASAEGGSGEYEYLIIDKSIKTRAGARERAAAELEAYKATLNEGSFQTYTSGLEPGQTIRINSDAHEIDQEFIIVKVNYKLWTHKKFVYTVTLATTKTFGIIDYLQKVLTDETKKIEINPDEVIDLIESPTETITMSEAFTVDANTYDHSETISMAETFTAQSLDYPVQWVWGTYNTPTGYNREGTWGGSYWNN